MSKKREEGRDVDSGVEIVGLPISEMQLKWVSPTRAVQRISKQHRL